MRTGRTHKLVTVQAKGKYKVSKVVSTSKAVGVIQILSKGSGIS